MTQAEKEQDNGKEKEKERDKEKEKEQQRGVKRPIAPPAIPDPLQEVRGGILCLLIPIKYPNILLSISKTHYSFNVQIQPIYRGLISVSLLELSTIQHTQDRMYNLMMHS